MTQGQMEWRRLLIVCISNLKARTVGRRWLVLTITEKERLKQFTRGLKGLGLILKTQHRENKKTRFVYLYCLLLLLYFLFIIVYLVPFCCVHLSPTVFSGSWTPGLILFWLFCIVYAFRFYYIPVKSVKWRHAALCQLSTSRDWKPVLLRQSLLFWHPVDDRKTPAEPWQDRNIDHWHQTASLYCLPLVSDFLASWSACRVLVSFWAPPFPCSAHLFDERVLLLLFFKISDSCLPSVFIWVLM